MHYYRVTDAFGNVSYEERPIASEIEGATELTEEEYNEELEAFYASMPQPEPTDAATEEDFLEALTDLGVIP